MAQLYYSVYTVQAAQISGTLSGFPALVSWTDARFKSTGNGGHVASSQGYDLIPYTDSTLTSRLDWEIQYYDPVTGTFIFWVKVPSAAVASTITFGYGDTGITTDQSTPTAVWTNDFEAVYHGGDGTTLSLADSTTNANTLTNNNGVTAGVGPTGGAFNFNGSTQYLSTATAYLPSAASPFTFSAWASPASTSGGAHNILSIGGPIVGGGYSIQLRRDSNNWNLYQNFGGNINATQGGGVTASVYKRVTATWDLTNISLYVDGALAQATACAGRSGLDQIQAWGNDLADGFIQYWDGLLGELYAISAARSANWLAGEFNNQSNQAAFWSLGAEVPVGGGGGATYPGWQSPFGWR